MATETEQPGPGKNRWTRWYMWVAYAATVLVVVFIIAAVTSSDGTATVAPEEQAASAEANQTAEQADQAKTAEQQAEDVPVTDTEYCRNVSVAVSEIPDFFPAIRDYTDAVMTASLVIPSAYDEYMADKKSALNIDVLAQLDYIDEAATEVKSLNVPEQAEKGHRKVENLADDLMDQTDEIREKYADLTESEGYAYITQHGISKDAPEYEALSTNVEYFRDAYTGLVAVYWNHVFDELQGSEHCEGWWD